MDLQIYYIDNYDDERSQGQVSCPYCESKFKDRIEQSKHIDGVHTGLGLLEGDRRKW